MFYDNAITLATSYKKCEVEVLISAAYAWWIRASYLTAIDFSADTLPHQPGGKTIWSPVNHFCTHIFRSVCWHHLIFANGNAINCTTNINTAPLEYCNIVLNWTVAGKVCPRTPRKSTVEHLITLGRNTYKQEDSWISLLYYTHTIGYMNLFGRLHSNIYNLYID